MLTGRPPVLNLRLNARPEAAGLVRAALGGLAEPFGLRPQLLNDLKTAISEACNNAVEHAYAGQHGAIAVHLYIGLTAVEVSVRDWGGGFQHVGPAGHRLRVGLPVINALADRAEFLTATGSGTEVRMGFDIRPNPRRDNLLARLEAREDVEACVPWRRGLSGDAVVTQLPRELLSGVLGPLSNAVAARARFSLERFSDVYLLTRGIGTHVGSAASSGRVTFALSAREHQLDLTIGPLRAGAGEQLRAQLGGLADELATDPIDHSERLRVVVRNGDRLRRAVPG